MKVTQQQIELLESRIAELVELINDNGNDADFNDVFGSIIDNLDEQINEF